MSWAESYHGKLRALAGDEEVLIMVGARCLLRDDQGRILLIRRSDNDLWAVPAAASNWVTQFDSARSARCTRRPG
jgi:ADP-ribose pyrophosphatase YjhB (NUDIX family)